MSETADRVIAALKAAALKAGIVDLDALKLADLSKVRLGAYGSVEGADELVASLKHAKPHLFVKHMRDMSEAEQKTWWEDHKRKFPGGGPPPAPMPTDKMAKDMTPAERDAFVREVQRRFG